MITIKDKNTKGFDIKTNNLKLSRAPMFSQTPIINNDVEQNPTQFQGEE